MSTIPEQGFMSGNGAEVEHIKNLAQKALDSQKLNIGDKTDLKAVAKELETVFLSEFLKVLMQETEFGKEKTLSTYMPIITSELSKSLAERGTGIGEFLTRNPALQTQVNGKEPGNAHQSTPSAPRIQSSPQESQGTIPAQPQGSELHMHPRGKISSAYGVRKDPFTGRLQQHKGIDIAMPEGTVVKPAGPGEVVFSGTAGGYGNCVVIEHGNGMRSLYAHNSMNLVKKGEHVDENTSIALSGATGRATGPHLHFEVSDKGRHVDPSDYTGKFI